jgi:hypothetical protein
MSLANIAFVERLLDRSIATLTIALGLALTAGIALVGA